MYVVKYFHKYHLLYIYINSCKSYIYGYRYIIIITKHTIPMYNCVVTCKYMSLFRNNYNMCDIIFKMKY